MGFALSMRHRNPEIRALDVPVFLSRSVKTPIGRPEHDMS
jgi:hypothetical protein